MRGRKPKPLERQVAEGDPRKIGKVKLGTMLKNQPFVDGNLPDCPERFSVVAKQAWFFWKSELENMKLAASCDEKSLEMACIEFDTYLRANKAVRRLGEVIEEQVFSRSGKVIGSRLKKNPWVDVRNRAFVNVARFTTEFGLSPMSRTRLTVGNSDDGMTELHAVLSGPRLAREEREKAMQ
jgi:P27 family predicted phage terminase small subunit